MSLEGHPHFSCIAIGVPDKKVLAWVAHMGALAGRDILDTVFAMTPGFLGFQSKGSHEMERAAVFPGFWR